MKVLIKKFFKNASILSIGTAISQFLGLVSIPILGRLYSPAQFGELATFTGYTLLIGLFTTLKYEKAIILPQKRREGDALVVLNVALVILVCVLVGLAFIILSFLNFHLLPVSIIFLLISIFATSTLSVQRQWLQREENYNTIAYITITQSILTLSIPIIIYYYTSFQNGLIVGYSIGAFLVLVGFGTSNYRKIEFQFFKNRNYLLYLFRKYKDFPVFYLPYFLFSSGLLYFLPIVLSLFYEENEVGFFNMAYKVLMVPHVIISFGLVNVFLVEAKRIKDEKKGGLAIFFRSIFLYVLLMGGCIYGLSYWIGSDLLIYLLGNEWNPIRNIFPAISIWLFFEFLSTTFKSNTYVITGKQYIGLIIQVINFFLAIGLIYLCRGMGFVQTIKIFVALMSAFSLIHLTVTYLLSYETDKLNNNVK